jgi:hypothetical protein
MIENMTMASLMNLLTIRDESRPGQIAIKEAEIPQDKSGNRMN